MTYQIIITEEVANVAVTSESYPIIIEYNATNISANATYGNTEVQAYLASGDITSNVIFSSSLATTGLIVASGNVSGSNIVTTGYVTATGNITGSYFLGNGSQLTGLPATYSDANVTTLLAAFGSNTISTTGNVTSGYIVANGSALTNLTGANVSGTVANATYATSAGSASTATLATYATTANAVAGANVSGTVANATYALTSNAATYSTIATFADTANAVAGANVSGTVANATYATSAGSATTATTAATVTDAAQGNITSVGTLTSLSVSGNITGGNVLSLGTVTAAGNLMSTQQTIVGTANTGTTGNIVVSGKNIATDMAWVPDGGTAVTGAYGRVLVGTGWAGNITHSAAQNRMIVSDAITRGNNSTSLRALGSEQFVSITGNVVNNSWRQQSLGGHIRIGGGSAANTVSSASTTLGVPFMVAAGQFNIDVGNIAPYNLGNTSISHAAINGGIMQFGGNSYVANAFGVYSAWSTAFGATVTGNVLGNVLGYSSAISTGATPSGNVYAFYHPSTTNRYGPVTGANTQAAPQYYAFYNEDDHAQVRLGSLRTYNENRYSTATSGTVNIDKNNAQVQYIAPTGNITIGDLQNFVTRTVTTYETDNQTDTVTLIIKQGATPYGITMPTGNAAIKYASNVSTVGTSANSVTMVSITGYYDGSANGYLVTISPEFV